MIREKSLAACAALILTVLGFQQVLATPPASTAPAPLALAPVALA